MTLKMDGKYAVPSAIQRCALFTDEKVDPELISDTITPMLLKYRMAFSGMFDTTTSEVKVMKVSFKDL